MSIMFQKCGCEEQPGLISPRGLIRPTMQKQKPFPADLKKPAPVFIKDEEIHSL